MIITSYLSGNGGIETVIQRMVNILPNNKYSFEVLSLTGGNKVNDVENSLLCFTGSESWLTNIKNNRMPVGSKFKFVNFIMHSIFSFYFILKSRPDIIICTGPSQPVYLSKIKKIFNKKYRLLIWPHFSLNSGFGNFKNIKYAEELLAISKGIAQQAEEMGFDNRAISYFPNPFEDNKNKIKNEMEYKKGKTFIYIGRFLFEGQKRLKDLIDAAKLLRGEFNIILIGDGKDLNLIKNYIKSKDLVDRFTINNGWHKNPWDVVNEIDALVLCSKFEGLPTVIGEAMSRGVPCISSDCETGPRDFIIDNKNGHLYKVGDYRSLAEVMQLYIDKKVSFDKYYINRSIQHLYDDAYIRRFEGIFGDFKSGDL